MRMSGKEPSSDFNLYLFATCGRVGGEGLLLLQELPIDFYFHLQQQKSSSILPSRQTEGCQELATYAPKITFIMWSFLEIDFFLFLLLLK